MIPEFGSFALSIATTLAIILAFYPLVGLYYQKPTAVRSAKWLTTMLFFSTLFALTCLIYILATNDFTVTYVAGNSNNLLPYAYRIVAAWNAYEGALLLWSTLLASCGFLFMNIHRQLPEKSITLILSLLGMINGGFLVFILTLANPFQRSLPYYPIDGDDLNPLLQSGYLIFHTPILYMGYVGFTLIFAAACATLIQGRFNKVWMKLVRAWALGSWICLTIGIFLGVLWSYLELQSANWWYWDPVENITLLPWLTGTALIHSIANISKNGLFKLWSIRLAISTFLFCLIATFLARSGVLASIHSFSASVKLGAFVIGYLAIVIIASLTLYFIQKRKLNIISQSVPLFSRTRVFLSNNVLLAIAAIAVFVGTFLPLFYEQLGIGELVNNARLFNQIFIYLTIPFALLLGLALFIRWRKQTHHQMLVRFIIITVFTAFLSLLFAWALGALIPNAVLGIFLSSWIIVHSICEVVRKMHANSKGFFKGFKYIAPKHWGMLIAHSGLAFLIFGITMTLNFSLSQTAVMRPNSQLTIGQYQVTFNAIEIFKGMKYTSEIGVFSVTTNQAPDNEIVLLPEHIQYIANTNIYSDTAVDSTLTRDIYIVLGEHLEGETWIVKVFIKPFQVWIWIGWICMILGTMLCLIMPLLSFLRQKRYTQKRPIRDYE